MVDTKPIIRTICRSCGCTNLLSILSLGDQYPSDFVDSTTSMKIPLELVLCNEDDVVLFEQYGSVLGLSFWPSLNNDEDKLRFYTNF